jgi:hypothetical protein
MAVGIAAVVGVAGAFAIATGSLAWAAETVQNVEVSIQVTDVRYFRRG